MPISVFLRSGSGLRISEVPPLCTKQACSTVEPPSQSEKTPLDFVDFGTQEIILNGMGFHMGVYMALHGFTWFLHGLL